MPETAEGLLRRLRLFQRGGLFQEIDGVDIVPAVNPDELRKAYKLVHKAFVEKGYINPRKQGMRIRVYETLPEMITFTAQSDGKVIGVQSLVRDSEFGLPSDHAFNPEIDSLRNQTLLYEATNQATDIGAIKKDAKKRGVPTELMRCCFAYAMGQSKIEGKQANIVTTISPKHVPLYEFLCFEQLGNVRDYGFEKGIKDPVVLMLLKLGELEQRVHDVYSPAEDVALAEQIYDWFVKHPYENLLPEWEEGRKRFFAEPAAAEEFFFQEGGLGASVFEPDLSRIRDKWRIASL
jgi:hypothetical protein